MDSGWAFGETASKKYGFQWKCLPSIPGDLKSDVFLGTFLVSHQFTLRLYFLGPQSHLSLKNLLAARVLVGYYMQQKSDKSDDISLQTWTSQKSPRLWTGFPWAPTSPDRFNHSSISLLPIFFPSSPGACSQRRRFEKSGFHCSIQNKKVWHGHAQIKRGYIPAAKAVCKLGTYSSV